MLRENAWLQGLYQELSWGFLGQESGFILPMSENLSEAELKHYGLVCLTEGMFGQESVQDGAEKVAEVGKKTIYDI